ncbi:putative TetR-family transcriptional regulator [Actinoplanes missouriensis 431]|uniref:Putative TetR-family transcriptional regulator n=1 Tax=Actinoplanes missouriensis (strain ATCC 14538 / DSM 43046 / CBS 188.64 / JCM 3121 / NBRC 102363 / NCIMB 12654 / NRRL B-3342 / UNCC 431) TaxID=512565 RepID=I0H7N3_ACTM4|nr:TetR/AcrR family transcriptional regulator [Actinoplanes missouriensis]BAL89020.1 putative TetR-family transcriptional regulator [Actinoplanes missouriensis 431]
MHVEASRRRRMEPDTRRGEILTVAVRLFGRRPYSDVSTTDVARAAGVARGLVNHYFGTKKDLYLEVVRIMLTVPAVALEQIPRDEPLEQRVDAIVNWFLDVVSRHSTSWLAAVNAGGMAGDAQVDAVIAEAIDVAADDVLDAVGLGDGASEALRGMARSYVGLAVFTGREWLQRGVLSREQVHALLATTLLTLVEQVFPQAR